MTTFIKAMRLRDVVLMNVVAVVGLRWIARGARTGAPSVTLWVLAWVAFFVPLALAVSRLSARYPEQGGVYVWVRRAFGPSHGFICGWCLWVNNLFYFPSLLLFGAANLAAIGGPGWQAVGTSRWFSVLFVLGGIWLAAGLNVLGLRESKWLQNAGSLGVWIPVGLLLGCGGLALARFGPATAFTPANLVPRGALLDTIGLWSAMCFAFSGFEISSLIGQEIENPETIIPRGVFISGIIVTIVYIAGSVSVLFAIPVGSLKELSGITDAVQLVTGRVGLGGLGALTGALLVLNALAGTASWTAGAARVPFAAGVDAAMPAAFARLHPRYRTPHVALVVQAAASSVIFLASVFVTVAGRSTSIQDAYDILVNLTILIYFVPYLYLFAAQTRLLPDTPTAVPWMGFAATAISLALTFVPPPGANKIAFEVNLVGQAIVVLGVGAGFYAWSRRRARR
ncbi:MAG TPA: APC family permease [Vicinamibacterales bacterium]